jgi:hypothetical protein
MLYEFFDASEEVEKNIECLDCLDCLEDILFLDLKVS